MAVEINIERMPVPDCVACIEPITYFFKQQTIISEDREKQNHYPEKESHKIKPHSLKE